MSEPFVSIIVPVHNSEKYLNRCLDSLLFQTFENIEIIIVNNASDDNSGEIIDYYVSCFPEKIKVITTEYYDRAGHGRNEGIKQAKGEYVLFCDSDDMIHYELVNNIYEKTLNNSYDMIVFDYYMIKNNAKFERINTNLREPISKKDLYVKGKTFIWNKCIKREILSDAGFMPEDISFEDLAYTMIVDSYVKEIGVVKKPLYFFYQRENSETQKAISDKNLELIDAFKYGIEHSNPCEEKLGYLMYPVFLGRIKDKFFYADRFIQYLKEIWDKCPKGVAGLEKVQKECQQYVDLPDSFMDHNIFINGFGEEVDPYFLKSVSENAFYDKCEITILNEKNCDIFENPIVEKAYLNYNYKFVGEYFALKKIFALGGIYLSKDIILDAPLNYLRTFPAFFGYLDESHYTDSIFGAMKNNEIIKALIETYKENFYVDTFCPLGDRITNILTSLYDIPLTGRSNLFSYEAAIFSPEVFIVDVKGFISVLNPELHMTHLNFSKFAGQDEYITLPHSLLKSLAPINVNRIAVLKNDKVKLENELKIKSKELENIKKEMEEKFKKEKNSWIKKREKEEDLMKSRFNIIEKEIKRLANENDRLSAENVLLFNEISKSDNYNLNQDENKKSY